MGIHYILVCVTYLTSQVKYQINTTLSIVLIKNLPYNSIKTGFWVVVWAFYHNFEGWLLLLKEEKRGITFVFKFVIQTKELHE